MVAMSTSVWWMSGLRLNVKTGAFRGCGDDPTILSRPGVTGQRVH
jgi:hypothetical protein